MRKGFRKRTAMVKIAKNPLRRQKDVRCFITRVGRYGSACTRISAEMLRGGDEHDLHLGMLDVYSLAKQESV